MNSIKKFILSQIFTFYCSDLINPIRDLIFSFRVQIIYKCLQYLQCVCHYSINYQVLCSKKIRTLINEQILYNLLCYSHLVLL